MTKRSYDLQDMFDDIFMDIAPALGATCIYPAQSFPPLDVILDEKTKDLLFRFAIAGYSKDEVDVSFTENIMTLSIEPKKKESERSLKFLKKGIKTSSVKAKYEVPVTKYRVDSTTAKVENGILEIFIPALEEIKPKSIKIE